MASIDIFIGARIEHASERATLARAVEFLTAQSIPAVLLANVNFGGRQIDLVVGLDEGALVVESKGLSAPVRGTENGDWQVLLSSGRWKETPNAYVQALNEKHAVRDAMARFAGGNVPYPDAALIFVPNIPQGSTIPEGDFKLSVGGLVDLPGRIACAKRTGWRLDQWQVFAAHHRLISVSSINAAISENLLDSEQLITAYSDEFVRSYGPSASTMVATQCRHDGRTISSDDVTEQVALGGNVLLIGDSGCGKSMLSHAIALAAMGHDRIPIVISAKDFDGNLRDVANREATLLGARSAATLISAARMLNRNVVLVIDGYNECKPSERPRLTRSIAAALKRYEATVVVSSKITLERDDLLSLSIFSVQAPDIGVKLAIAQRAASGAPVDAYLELLTSVSSGLEARMIGQLGQRIPAGTSRYGLFDAYLRDRLGAIASDGIRILSRIAGVMTERISFSLSVREVDRILDREGASGILLQELRVAKILEIRGDRVGFSHEMFLNVFAAEAIIRRAGDNPDAVVTALRLPQHLDAKPLVLGAIDDDNFRRQVLSSISDKQVIRFCFTGQCGPDAQVWANMRCDDVLSRIEQEIETVQFEVSEESLWSVRVKPETISKWNIQDNAILAAIPHELVAGRRLDRILYLIGKLDNRLIAEHRRLWNEAKEKNVSLRSGLYAVSYAAAGTSELGLGRISGPIHNGHLYGGPKVAASADLVGRLHSPALSPGQVGLLIELDRYSDRDAPSLGTVLPEILDRIWKQAPHHLRLGLMHAVCMCAHALNDDERSKLIAGIEQLLPANGGLDSTGMIDALKALGALDDGETEHLVSVKREIEVLLADPEDPLMWRAADGTWIAQFDHPYDSAYCEAWAGLPPENRKALLRMAVRGADADSMFTPPLIAELASFADALDAPLISRFTGLPAKTNVILGDGIQAFEMAHIALARLRFPLPSHTTNVESPADEALLAAGAILYWLNREELGPDVRRFECAKPLSVLLQHETGVAAAILCELARSDVIFKESARRLPGKEPIVASFFSHFSDATAAIYRAALEHPERQSGYYNFFRLGDVIEAALVNLASLGNTGDIALLRAWSLDPDHGHSAVRAIRKIEEAAQTPKPPSLNSGTSGRDASEARLPRDT